MNKQQKKLIKENILKIRELLEKDIAERLIRYGIYQDPTKWVPIEKLKHLNQKELQTRKNIEKTIQKLAQEMTLKEAVQQYIKEVTYTFTNRIAALRLLEVHGIIPTILEKQQEYENKSPTYRDFTEIAGELCNTQDQGWPYLLRIVFKEISTEIKILFDPEDEYSLITPSNQATNQTIQTITEKIPKELWQQFEIIGWIYQYFNEEEKKEYKEAKRKARANDVPVITQLYTPKWIVKYIIDNTLGTYWIEMHPESKIKEHCTYYIETQEHKPREPKKVSEIKLIDPACGSGNFLLQAFDVLYKMYLEEREVSEKEIPTAILANNLYGIDIDLRAIQLTALTLFTKAKSYNKEAEIKQINVVAADAILKDKDNKERLIKKIKGKLPVAEKLVETIWDSFANIREYGSLLRIEDEIKIIVEEEREKQKDTKLEQFEAVRKTKDQETISGFLSSDRYWQQVQDSIIEEVKNIAKESLKVTDISQSMFAAEAEKTMHLLDFFFQRYDVVVTNPPYLDKRDMNDNLKVFLKKNYPTHFSNLYTSFIARCIELTYDKGYIGMLTPQSFMFLSSLLKTREEILYNTSICSLLHLGYGAIEDAYVDLAAFCLKKARPQKETYGIYYRLISNKIDKILKFEQMLLDLKKDKNKVSDYFIVEQKDLLVIKGEPITYWLSKEFIQLFSKDLLEKVVENAARTKTAENDKYLRFKWEVSQQKMNLDWKPYTKGGEYTRWYQIFDYVILWTPETIAHLRESSDCRITEEKYWFIDGITFSAISKKGFSARYLPKGFIFDVAGPCLFSKGRFIDDYPNFDMYLLGLLNSKFGRYCQFIVNPTVNFQTNDIKRIPYIKPPKEVLDKVTILVTGCVKNKKEILKFNELSSDFDKPALLDSKEVSIINNFNSVKNKLIRLKEQIINNEKKIDELIFNNYNVNGADKKIIIDELLNSASDEDLQITKIFKIESEIENLLSYLIGLLFGRWKYEGISADKDGVLSFDETRRDYIIKRIRDSLELIFGTGNVDKREREITEAIGKSLDKYFLNDFFNSHCKKYKKRPIYWHIQSPNKYFNCLVYYHKLDDDTIYKVKSTHIKKQLEIVENKIKNLNSQINAENSDREKVRLQKELSELQSEKEDLETTDNLLQEIIDEGYKPDIDEGVKANILPFVDKGLIKVKL